MPSRGCGTPTGLDREHGRNGRRARPAPAAARERQGCRRRCGTPHHRAVPGRRPGCLLGSHAPNTRESDAHATSVGADHDAQPEIKRTTWTGQGIRVDERTGTAGKAVVRLTAATAGRPGTGAAGSRRYPVASRRRGWRPLWRPRDPQIMTASSVRAISPVPADIAETYTRTEIVARLAFSGSLHGSLR
jgi:hypothetical protein